MKTTLLKKIAYGSLILVLMSPMAMGMDILSWFFSGCNFSGHPRIVPKPNRTGLPNSFVPQHETPEPQATPKSDKETFNPATAADTTSTRVKNSEGRNKLHNSHTVGQKSIEFYKQYVAHLHAKVVFLYTKVARLKAENDRKDEIINGLKREQTASKLETRTLQRSVVDTAAQCP